MKILIVLTLLLSSIVCFSQEKVSDSVYKTRKGQIIKTGDTLTLAVGSLPNGNFNYVMEVGLWNGVVQLNKSHTNSKLLVVSIAGGTKKTDDKVFIKCTYLGKKKPWVAVEPDAAFIKEEVYLPGQ